MNDNNSKNRLLTTLGELEITKNQLSFWTDSIEELSEIQDGLILGNPVLTGKSILDIGTDCIKPFYIALKFQPSVIIGIDEGLLPFGSEIQRSTQLLVNTKLRFYNCSLFEDQKIAKILKLDHLDKFDFVLTSKTLHHLRTGECLIKNQIRSHVCTKEETDCQYEFDEEKVFSKLLTLGERVIIYESFAPGEDDADKTRGRGGYFTVNEWKRVLSFLVKKYRVTFVLPRLLLTADEIIANMNSILKQVDIICFFVENKES